MSSQNVRLIFLAGIMLTVAACGGGGGGGVASTPPPPTTPPPPPPPPPAANTVLDIINNAPTGNLAVAGATTSGSLGDPEFYEKATLAPNEQPQMRYDAATNTYEIKLAGGSWEELWTNSKDLPEWTRYVGIGQTGGVIGLNGDRKLDTADEYPYSSIGWWSDVSRTGEIAVGVPTPAGALPISGSAQYEGIVGGATDIFVEDTTGPFGGVYARGVTGNVLLAFDFSTGALSGSIEPKLSATESLGVYTFKNTVYSGGSYSGQFNSSVSGPNGFYGQLTGPQAQELIGAWTLPFHYLGDDQDHGAFGTWVAKKKP